MPCPALLWLPQQGPEAKQEHGRLGKASELEKHFVLPTGDAGMGLCSAKTRGVESLLDASTQGHCRGPAAAPGFLLLCKLLLFAVTNLFFSFSPPFSLSSPPFFNSSL